MHADSFPLPTAMAAMLPVCLLQDLLLLLEARTAAAALMRAASTTTANLLVHLSYADPQHETQRLAVENDSLLDALVCEYRNKPCIMMVGANGTDCQCFAVHRFFGAFCSNTCNPLRCCRLFKTVL